MRLAKYLAHSGVASRRASEAIVAAGRVTVGGSVVTDPAFSVDSDVIVTVDGKAVAPSVDRVVYMLNKPAGVVSTAHDPQSRPTVVELVPSKRRLYPVGRLDIDTTGLILLTDDGGLAQRLTHPSFEVTKTYVAKVGNAPVSNRALAELRKGVRLDDGLTAPAGARLRAPDQIELKIHEGRKRQVRRMCEAVGHPVRSLRRVAIGSIGLGDLKPGEFRLLGRKAIEKL